MPGQPVQVGPFLGGLNTSSDPTAVADNEVVFCENFELDFDGSLKSRPPIVDIGVDLPLGATGNMTLLGWYIDAGNVSYLLASDGLTSTYYLSGSSWVLITNTLSATAMAQFDGKAWLLAPVGWANPSGWWSPSGGFNAVADMPKGDVIVAWKFRLWVVRGKDAASNATRLYFSKILGQPTFWPTTTDFIDVGAGDGQAIVQLCVYYNTLLIFRTNSIYGFNYSTDPASGVTSIVAPGVGLENRDCLVPFESYIYLLYNNKAYEFMNNRANQINTKVLFRSSDQTGIYKPYTVSLFNRRIIFAFYDKTYVFSLNTRTWTTWNSSVHGPLNQLVEIPGGSGNDNSEAYLCRSTAVPTGATRTAKLLKVVDAITSNKEQMDCTLVTKNYNYEASSMYKRLYWWGADAVFRGQVVATARPITYNQSISWGQLLANATWGSSLSYTWSQPLSGLADVQTIRDTSGTGSMRKFVRFLKSLRFRQISYRLVFTTDGSVDTAPVRLFSMMTYVTAKEHVSKTVT